MCRKVTCRQCGKATYSGCGQHVDQVLAGVPKAQRCDCASKPATKKPAGESKGLFGRLFGR